MDERLTPEQLVEKLRGYADVLKDASYDELTVQVLGQAADLIESQGKQLDVAAEDWDMYQDCRDCPNYGSKVCSVASDRRCPEIIRERWAEEAAKR